MTADLSRPASPAADVRRVAQARVGVFVLFVGMGVVLGTQVSRIPSIRDSLQVSPAQLAALFIVGSIGGLLAFAVVGWLNAKIGALALMRGAVFAFFLGFWGMGLGTFLGNPVVFAVSVFVLFFGFELNNTIANAEAATVERRMGRSVMSQFHASFSLAMLAGIGLGVVFSHQGVDPLWHFGTIVTLVAVSYLIFMRRAILDPMPAASGSEEAEAGVFGSLTLAFKERRTLMIGIVVFCAFSVEMSAADWVPLAVVDDFNQPEWVGDVFYASFVIAMSTVRVVGSRFIDRFGRVLLVRVSALCVIAGSIAFAFTPVFWVAPVALFVWGVGCALTYPLAISAAADQPIRATSRVAAAAAFGTIAGLTIPQFIGFAAEAVELRKALLVVVAAATVMFVLAKALKPLDLSAEAAEASAAPVPADTLKP